ncbi:MAG: cytochrome c [Deltaproteobacteria bacterium]|nr:cytochrome c [Deltaproteobacteria bacterium]
MKITAPIKLALVTIGVYVALKLAGVFYGSPVPSSVIELYVIFTFILTILVLTVSDSGTEELFGWIGRALYSKGAAKVVVLLILPLVFSFAAYLKTARRFEGAAKELRVVHPPPPSVIKAYGRDIELKTLVNPLRAIEKTDKDKFAALVEAGRDIYFVNCVLCHGAKLDGKGMYAASMDPRPLAFKGSDTIAQIEETYVFWRIVKGGQGLPIEAMPHKSAMPAWEATLTEEEVWKAVLFIYDYTGNRPREHKL